MKGLIWLIILIIVVGLLFLVFSGNKDDSTNDLEDNTETSETLDADSAKLAVVGKWQSTEDTKYMSTFNADGTLLEEYEGDDSATQNGTWVIKAEADEAFLSALELESLGELAGPYMLKVLGDTTLGYQVVEASEDRLVLNYLSNGGVLEFVKVDSSMEEETVLEGEADETTTDEEKAAQ